MPESTGSILPPDTVSAAEPRRAPALVIVPPPVLYLLAFGAGMLLGRLVPWRPAWISAATTHWVGLALIAAGLILAPGSAGLFGLRRTTLNPVGRPSHLVTHGPYRLSRNPMYLGVTLVYIGVSLALGLAWPLVFLPLPLGVLNLVVIPFEEARLRETFGPAYADYCQRVRRWV